MSINVITRNVDRSLDSFPDELAAADGGIDRLAEVAARKAEMAAQVSHTAAHAPFGFADVAGTLLWTAVLWFGVFNDVLFPRAARPSDLVLPALGRLLGYSADRDQWLDDFERGSRGEYPVQVLAAGLVVFGLAGAALQAGIAAFFEGAAGAGVQFGVIGCLWAGAYEIGRIETGDSLNSRQVDDELARVYAEFTDFASARLERVDEQTVINQLEVVSAFRRFCPRHRSPELGGGASDATIVKCFKRWYFLGYDCYQTGYGETVSNAPTPTANGFFKGVAVKEYQVF